MVIIPGIELLIGWVVVDHAIVQVAIMEGYADGLGLVGVCVEHVVDSGVGQDVAGNSVESTADHEGIGHCVLADVGLPALGHLQVLGVQL